MDKESEILSRLRQRGLAPECPPPTPDEPDAITPATRYQESIWLLDQLDPSGLEYLVLLSWRLRGDLDTGRLARAWRQLTDEQDALRCGLRPENGRLTIDPDRPAPALEIRAGDPVSPPASERLDLATGASSRAVLTGAGADWRLDITVHHAFFDDWSSGLLMPRLAELYAEPGTATRRPSLSFARWARQSRQTTLQRQDTDAAYWAETLRDVDIDHGLTCHAGDGRQDGVVRATVPLTPAAVTDLLRAVAATGTGPASVLLALWWSTLHRAGGKQDLVIGTPVSQRWSRGSDETIGLCVNTVPLRPLLTGPPTFRQAVRACHASVVDAVDHAALPFPDIVTAAGAPRSTARHQLFRAWFAAVDRSGEPDGFAGIEVTPADCADTPPKFEIALYALRTPDGWVLEIEADAAAYTRDFVDDLARRCAVLGRAVTAEPDRALGSIPLVSAGEARDRRATGPRVPLAVGRLEQLFREQALRTPAEPALIERDRHVTYAELDHDSDRLAAYLVREGVPEGARVAIAMSRGRTQITAVLAVLKAGATYVALDRKNPVERTARILDVARPELILTDPGTAGLLPDAWRHRLRVLDGLPRQHGTDAPPQPRRGDDAPAYITFTSGSTGLPKGIEMPHRAVTNLVSWLRSAYGSLRPGGRVLQYASLSFDMSAEEIYSALHSGAALVLIDEDVQRDVAELARAIAGRRVSLFFMPAPALQQLAAYAVTHGIGTAELTTVISEADQLVVTDPVRRWFTGSAARLHNQYGPSETHVTTRYTLPSDPAEWPAWVPVGRPLANVDVRVLDSFGEPALHDASGEVYIGGIGVAHGYVGRPATTAAAFTPDDDGARLYRTGDVARFDPSGDLVFLGRRDGQVKIRGFRIETREVQLCLNGHPAVSDSFVRRVETPEGSAELAAYVVPVVGRTIAAGALRTHMLTHLPDYMCPRTFTFLPELPLTVNRKVDVARLPAPDLGALARETAGAAPRGETEESMAGLFRDVLEIPVVGRDDDFFALGGSSLLATSLVWRIEERFGVSLSMRLFYIEPNVAALSARVLLLRSEAPDGAAATPAPVDPAEISSRVADILSEFR